MKMIRPATIVLAVMVFAGIETGFADEQPPGSSETVRFSADASSAQQTQNPFYNNLEAAPDNGSFRMEDYIVWGGSVIQGDDGRYYMFASRWPKAVGMQNWVTNSEVVLASSDQPDGPYTFEKVALPDRGPQYWDGSATHNPTIHRHEDTYLLFYVGINYEFDKPTESISRDLYGQAWNTKRIGVAWSDSPRGPWNRMDAPILEPRPGEWDAALTSNPAPVVHEDGSVLLIYKSAPVPYPEREENRTLQFGAATAEHWKGPYERLEGGRQLNIESVGLDHVEDSYIWMADGKYHMVAKMFGRRVTGEHGAGFYAYSNNGFDWKLTENPRAYGRSVEFRSGEERTLRRLERPQVLVEDGVPTHIFFAAMEQDSVDIYNLVIPVSQD